jgi:hypothetical protein
MTSPRLFVLNFTNVDATSRGFATLDEAIAEGRRIGFEFTVWHADGRFLASWTIFGGLRLA